MIKENTWHKNQDHQKSFVWAALEEGIQLYHGEVFPYIISLETFHIVLDHAKTIAIEGSVKVGTSMDKPPIGSLGHWVINQNNLTISGGQLSPKHLSFLGPVYARMGFIEKGHDGNAILWKFRNTL